MSLRSTYFAASVALLSLLAPISTLAQVAAPSAAWEPAPASDGNNATVAGSRSQWENTFGDTLWFYDAQRSGVLPDDFRVTWRNDSVLTDGESVGLDLSGGFFDAGNMVKFIHPLSWVLTQIAHSALLHGDAYTTAEQEYYLDSTLRNGLGWIMNASSQTDELYVAIGNESSYWGGDQGIPQPRQIFSVSRQKPGTDVFAGSAAALAAGAMIYAGTPLPLSQTQNGTVPTGLLDTAYATELRERAVVLMDLATTAEPQQVYQDATDGVAWAYPSTNYEDELVLGAAFTALATRNISLVTTAIDAYDFGSFPTNNGVLNWDTKDPLLPSLMARLSVAMPGADSRANFTKFQTDSEVYLDLLVNGTMQGLSTTSGGLAWWKDYSEDSSLNPALNAALLCLWTANLTSNDTKSTSYLNWAQSQIDYSLGHNPLNTVYQVGLHPNSAYNPQSSLASGGDDIDQIDTDPPVERWVLYGAVVGGPDKDDQYYDVRSDWQQSEPALDTVSPMVGISAYFVNQGSSAAEPYYVGLTAKRIVPKMSSGGLSGGAIAGIVIGVIIALALLGAALWFCLSRRSPLAGRRRRNRKIMQG
ncbi:Six-hairpin glycosidase [Microstroma glucosiphilum]|uniref:cellulase n=1 Tax=Pseudomicrostroma glucosiphilum TaxID=1684307 RepID=A0A316U412_9BASI|nr:Six-hairpin glycosidase [Pseudomicrostroma glucosiphilum]PWN20026.1 Six-hairpin glycosidase [Pseudomicrostroma glucosiphilum]